MQDSLPSLRKNNDYRDMRKVIFLILLPFILVLGYALVIDALKYGGTSVILDITELMFYIIYIISFLLSVFATVSIKDWLKKRSEINILDVL